MQSQVGLVILADDPEGQRRERTETVGRTMVWGKRDKEKTCPQKSGVRETWPPLLGSSWVSQRQASFLF